MAFPCTGCGQCCRRISGLVGKPSFPYKAKDDGSCEMLTADNKCSIYDTRPEVCRVDKMIEKAGMDKERAYKMTAELCNLWIDEAGLPESFKVKI